MNKRWGALVVMGACLVAFRGTLCGQEGAEEARTSSTSISMLGGAWTSGAGGWWLGEVRVSRRLNQDFVARFAFTGIARPGLSCKSSLPDVKCSSRGLIQQTSIGVSFKRARGPWHPTTGVSLGWANYGGGGGVVLAVGAGAQFDVSARLGLLGEAAFQSVLTTDGPAVAGLWRVGVAVGL